MSSSDESTAADEAALTVQGDCRRLHLPCETAKTGLAQVLGLLNKPWQGALRCSKPTDRCMHVIAGIVMLLCMIVSACSLGSSCLPHNR